VNPARPGDPFRGLTLESGLRKGEGFVLVCPHFEYGAAVHNKLSLPDAGLAEKQGLLRRDQGGRYKLVDFQRDGCVRLNGQPVEALAIELGDGDRIQLGQIECVYHEDLPWNPDAGREGISDSLPEVIPRSIEALEAASIAWSHRLRCLCTTVAAELALPVWQKHCDGHEMEYYDTVVGMQHVVDPGLPARAVDHMRACVDGGVFRPDYQVDDDYGEPITALQDDDFELPEAVLMAYYGIYNAFNLCVGLEFPGREHQACALSVHQSHVARILQLQDPSPQQSRAQFDPWWLRCKGEWASFSVSS
jgi:hypothetical protein